MEMFRVRSVDEKWESMADLIRQEFATMRTGLVSDLSGELQEILLRRSPGRRGTFNSEESGVSAWSQAGQHDWMHRHQRSYQTAKLIERMQADDTLGPTGSMGSGRRKSRTRRLPQTFSEMPPIEAFAERSLGHRMPVPLEVQSLETPALLAPSLRVAGNADVSPEPDPEVSKEPSETSSIEKTPSNFKPSMVEWAFSNRPRSMNFEEPAWAIQRWPLRLVNTKSFEALSMLMLCANAVTVGLQTDHMAVTLDSETPRTLRLLDITFCIFFGFELLLRLAGYGSRFLTMSGFAWNLLDLTLVTVQVSEELLLALAGGLQSNTEVMRVVRVLRAIKVVRLVGAVRVAEDLQLLINCLFLSLKQFMWAVMLLLLAIYVMAILVTQAATAHRLEALADGGSPTLRKWWGSIPTSVMSLFKGVTGSLDWGQLADPLIHEISPWFGLLFFMFMSFCVLALLNASWMQAREDTIESPLLLFPGRGK
ncbi:unnamed protein product [Effrenium voratum]|nr:unnamed protein product [Effrenium voratum]